MDKSSFSGDGVVTGSGLIGGRPVFVYSQDFTGTVLYCRGTWQGQGAVWGSKHHHSIIATLV